VGYADISFAGHHFCSIEKVQDRTVERRGVARDAVIVADGMRAFRMGNALVRSLDPDLSGPAQWRVPGAILTELISKCYRIRRGPEYEYCAMRAHHLKISISGPRDAP
jgi:hypothetical protein